MKTCPLCGIRFENQEGKCPLCEQETAETEIRNKAAFTREFYWRLYSIFSLAAFLIILVIDFVYTPGLSWSKIPLLAISYLWITLFLLMKIGLKSFTPQLLEGVVTVIMMALLDGFTAGKPWFIDLALPVMIAAGALFSLTLLVCRMAHLRLLQTTALNVFMAGIFLILLELLLKHHQQGTFSLSWSLIAFVCLLPLSIFFIYFDNKIKKSGKELKKYFHL
ncbi:MAG: DUF6320 domain-containing protein [Candidatus Cloacimonetes bacterium]|nr:DUF6320 domain-containing protein [Candidatus Cloacimonadota bacterium]